jgi:hypothetical protein
MHAAASPRTSLSNQLKSFQGQHTFVALLTIRLTYKRASSLKRAGGARCCSHFPNGACEGEGRGHWLQR